MEGLDFLVGIIPIKNGIGCPLVLRHKLVHRSVTGACIAGRPVR
jgi:hypothetical protein